MCANAQKAEHLKELMAEIRAVLAERRAKRLAGRGPRRPLAWALGILRRA